MSMRNPKKQVPSYAVSSGDEANLGADPCSVARLEGHQDGSRALCPNPMCKPVVIRYDKVICVEPLCTSTGQEC